SGPGSASPDLDTDPVGAGDQFGADARIYRWDKGGPTDLALGATETPRPRPIDNFVDTGAGLPLERAQFNEAVTHDMRHLVLRLVEPKEIKFFPGQYVDIAVPGTEATRSFSMANISSRDSGLLEFVIKIYPDGLFSHFLDTQVAVGDRLNLTGPFGVFTLREGEDVDLIFLGGGAGMAPILSLLRSMAERGIQRKATYYYGARGHRDLCFEQELRDLEQSLTSFRYIPALSEPAAGDAWDGEVGLITDVVKRHENDLKGAHAYVCGPPPMVEAAIPMLTLLGVPEKRIYYDKFTTTGDPGEQ
ncbi:MAG: FAD-binding oxidoreductase, partial [Mycobacteriaceae bacterium]